jgi:hypothetical protein
MKTRRIKLSEIKAGALRIGQEYTMMDSFGGFTKGSKVTVEDIKNYGSDIRIELMGDGGVSDFFILDVNDDLDLF